MARGKRDNNLKKSNGAALGFEATLWAAADKLRNNMDVAECKHVVKTRITVIHTDSNGILAQSRCRVSPQVGSEPKREIVMHV